MEAFTALVTQASDYLWNWVLLILLVGTGLYFTLRLRFVQVRRFGEGMRRLFGGFSLHGKAAGKDGMSSFQALTTAVAAQVGTGNITGCATALVSGGPGALFWVWVSAFLGMATIYAEAVLAQKYKTTVDGLCDRRGRSITYAPHSAGGSAAFWRASSRWRSSWRLALWAIWSSPIPSAMRSTTRSASANRWSALSLPPWLHSSFWAV